MNELLQLIDGLVRTIIRLCYLAGIFVIGTAIVFVIFPLF